MGADPRELIAARIKASRRIAVTSHLRPDGDSLCTALALAGMGALLGKHVDIVNHDPTPVPFSGFPELAGIRIGQIRGGGFRHRRPPRVRRRLPLRPGRPRRGLQDQHRPPLLQYRPTPTSTGSIPRPRPSARWSSISSASSASARRPRSPRTSTAPSSPTPGSFHFSNTTPRALAAATELARLGASPNRVAEKIYYNNRPEKILLLGRVLSSLIMTGGGRIAVITMLKRDTEALGLREVDTEDMTTLARSIQGVEMVMFFKEMGPETFRVSLRSKGNANAARVAEHFGGGGHVHASGFTVYGPYEQPHPRGPGDGRRPSSDDGRRDPSAGQAA
ncbi:MAG: DHHA1 domain-containing protein [Candidatus Moduliflexus flocculans]|nr:DHHA1 domain-containing protein [Candidatus Moduliflexus flocculans]